MNNLTVNQVLIERLRPNEEDVVVFGSIDFFDTARQQTLIVNVANKPRLYTACNEGLIRVARAENQEMVSPENDLLSTYYSCFGLSDLSFDNYHEVAEFVKKQYVESTIEDPLFLYSNPKSELSISKNSISVLVTGIKEVDGAIYIEGKYTIGRRTETGTITALKGTGLFSLYDLLRNPA